MKQFFKLMNEGAAWQPGIHFEVVAIFVYEPVFL